MKELSDSDKILTAEAILVQLASMVDSFAFVQAHMLRFDVSKEEYDTRLRMFINESVTPVLMALESTVPNLIEDMTSGDIYTATMEAIGESYAKWEKSDFFPKDQILHNLIDNMIKSISEDKLNEDDVLNDAIITDRSKIVH